MPLQATSGAASYDAFGGGVAAVPVFIENVFQTWLYTGNASSQTITNGLDLSTKGGLVWIKSRQQTTSNVLIDSDRGAAYLESNSNQPENASSTTVSSLNTDGFSLSSSAIVNGSGFNYASWSFRQQQKFFDVLTYTGNGTAGTAISHNLGSTPGFILVKRTDTGGSTGQNWAVWHRSAAGAGYLNSSDPLDASFPNSIFWGNGSSYVAPTSTTFTVTTSQNVNASGGSYVAYLFAHNAGGFGLAGTDNVISCGSFDGTSGTEVNLGYEPQWIMFKNSTNASNWQIVDSMRGLFVGSADKQLLANATSVEGDNNLASPTSTGFTWLPTAAGNTYIYIAIRRGPMKVPTSGTDVFQPVKFISTASRQTIGSLPAVDMFFGRRMASIKDWGMSPRLTKLFLKPNLTDGEDSSVTGYGDSAQFDLQNGSSFISAGSGDEFVTYNLRRSPSYMDVVCYTGNGGSNTITHNLGVAPELIIFKSRSATENWVVFTDFGPIYFRRAYLDLTNSAPQFGYGGSLLDSAPTATTISLLSGTGTNSNTTTYLAYLFATCAGVSKVGTYTGTGTTLQINCGFTAGARFVLIKRADSTGDWYVWDSARGIVAGNDPYLLLNSAAAEVTSTDYVDTYSAGFEISSTAPSAINASGGTFIFLAIA
jgi:hypothetical protein